MCVCLFFYVLLCLFFYGPSCQEINTMIMMMMMMMMMMVVTIQIRNRIRRMALRQRPSVQEMTVVDGGSWWWHQRLKSALWWLSGLTCGTARHIMCSLSPPSVINPAEYFILPVYRTDFQRRHVVGLLGTLGQICSGALRSPSSPSLSL